MNDITILKPKDVKPLRDELLTAQEGRCLICGELIVEGKANLDHDHDSGRVRGVLCKVCNTGEGALIRAVRHRYAPRAHMCWTNPLQFIRNILGYWNREQLPYIHPTFSVETGKQKTPKRRRKKRT